MTAFDGGRDSDVEGKMPPLFVREQPRNWPDDLAEREAEFEGDEYGVAGRLLKREVAAGFAAYGRLAIDGGPLTEQPHRHRGPLVLALAAVIVIARVLLALAIVALFYGAWLEIRPL